MINKLVTGFVTVGTVMILILILSQYIECKSEGSTLVRGLITMECINESR